MSWGRGGREECELKLFGELRGSTSFLGVRARARVCVCVCVYIYIYIHIYVCVCVCARVRSYEYLIQGTLGATPRTVIHVKPFCLYFV